MQWGYWRLESIKHSPALHNHESVDVNLSFKDVHNAFRRWFSWDLPLFLGQRLRIKPIATKVLMAQFSQ